MAHRRFFVDRIEEGRARLTGDDAHHLARVLRAEAGQQYEIADGCSVFLAEVIEVSKSAVEFRTIERLPEGPQLPPLTLFAALFKFDRFEWMVEKATELGVTRIVPVETARTEAGLMAAARKRVERWRKIARESAQQCRRIAPPEIAEACELAKIACSGRGYRLEEISGSIGLWGALETAEPGPLHVLIGPEGGWTDPERTNLNRTGWTPVSLGPTILRAETAAIAAAGIVAVWWDRRLH